MQQNFTILLLVAVMFGGNADAQMRAMPLTGSSVVYEMDTYSVIAPQGKDWFELKRDKQHAFFGKKLASPTHSFIAIASADSITEKFSTPEDYRNFLERASLSRADKRNMALESQVEVDRSFGRFCVKYYTKAADRDAIHARGKTLFVETFGVNCLHPDINGLAIDVSYTERGHPAEFNPGLRAEGESFMRSLKFISR